MNLINGEILDILAPFVAGGLFWWTVRRQWSRANERRHAGQKIKDLALLLEHTAECILRLDLRGYFIETHDAGARMMGWRSNQIVGKHWRELLSPIDAGRVEKALAQPGETPIELEVRAWHQQGYEVHQRLTIFKSRDDHGRLKGYEWLCKDITQ
ncbi:MAG TPA: PAS domain-containing protein, partial [Tepidisphaeraceae bacterium]|nr:PAS domain-containing protein [Tepidisphaeraceae bacterium]